MEAKVKIYSTPTCPYCISAKAFLKQHNLEFEEIDVSASTESAEELRRMSGQMGVPVLEINGQIIVGFDRAAISQALGIGQG